MDELFEAIASERLTASGRSCVAIAKKIWEAGFRSEEGQSASSSTEARAWIRLGLEADKDDLARRVKKLEDKVLGKTRGRATADRMRDRKRAAGDNVLPIRGGKDSI